MTNPNIPNAAEIKEALRLLHYSSDLHPNDKRIKPLVALANQYLSGELIRKAEETILEIDENGVVHEAGEKPKLNPTLIRDTEGEYIPKAGLPTEELINTIKNVSLTDKSRKISRSWNLTRMQAKDIANAIHTRLEGGEHDS